MPGATATRWATFGCAIVATRQRPFKRAGDPPPSMGGDMTDDELLDDNAAERAQAAALRDQARAGRLRFEAYLTKDQADWLLEQIARGRFADPSEAVFLTRSEEHTSELQSLMRISYAVFCLKKNKESTQLKQS